MGRFARCREYPRHEARRGQLPEQWIESRLRELSGQGQLYVDLSAFGQPGVSGVWLAARVGP